MLARLSAARAFQPRARRRSPARWKLRAGIAGANGLTRAGSSSGGSAGDGGVRGLLQPASKVRPPAERLVVSRKERVSWFVLWAIEDPFGRTEGTARAGAVRVLVGWREEGSDALGGSAAGLPGCAVQTGSAWLIGCSACPRSRAGPLGGLGAKGCQGLGRADPEFSSKAGSQGD